MTLIARSALAAAAGVRSGWRTRLVAAWMRARARRICSTMSASTASLADVLGESLIGRFERYVEGAGDGFEAGGYRRGCRRWGGSGTWSRPVVWVRAREVESCRNRVKEYYPFHVGPEVAGTDEPRSFPWRTTPFLSFVTNEYQ